MKILITGAGGFLGKNLVAELESQGYEDLLLYTRNNTMNDLEEYTKKCDFIYHLAGVNRPENEEEFMDGNYGFTSKLLELLKKYNNKSPILITSSIQAEKENPYGTSKKAVEDLLFEHSMKTGTEVFVYRLPNLFGKWSKPNYNTVVATYCYNIARDLDIQVNDPDADLTLCYIDDVLAEFVKALKGNPTKNDSFCIVETTYTIKLGNLASLIKGFKESRTNLSVPNMDDPLTKKLYSTYLSFLPTDEFSYKLKMNVDNRGSFTEFIRTPDRGQVSVNVSKPGITKGNHWHHTKNEKFLVVSGIGLIRFRNIHTEEVIEYKVSGDKLQVVDIPVGYTHSIVNVGHENLVTVMWVNESFNPDDPDTYFLEV
ncbi:MULTISPECIES: capsular polysaccharide biosynthesis protein CapF [unclassified Sporosarcina]|uniref:capsular polysaccharide biosynthesis protein CapF n=1 Tax=unclassified Sporosarcina TaxID=2647733 RepID=UPI000C162D6A|nr:MULTISPECIES: capsular polysaccharide biosynthesis protein CapF [unclassified Sporosarcina]PID05898.1 capsular biosynthesis protein [Sporosarcina sp. P30]PID09092.1 capsular biosynthesis protein [Sporosarcina sp. P31]PID12389.1 capsular biosynthesis protein [Sporosarcina sp. P32b]